MSYADLGELENRLATLDIELRASSPESVAWSQLDRERRLISSAVVRAKARLRLEELQALRRERGITGQKVRSRPRPEPHRGMEIWTRTESGVTY